MKQIVQKIWWLWPLLAGVVVYALSMNLAVGQSIWFDEGYSIGLAQQPVGELLALTAVDAHPPFYYLLLKAWAGLFGWSEFALRSLSAVLAGLAVAAAFLLVRKLFSLKTALLMLPVVVLAPFLLRYGYEVRMYALVSFIGISATLVLVYARQMKKLWLWALYAVLVAIGMYTLYFSVVIWVAHAVYLLWDTIKTRQSLLKQPWVYAFVGAVALFAPYLPTFIYQMTHSALPGIGGQVTLTTLGGILSMLFAFTADWQQTGVLTLALLGVLILGIMAGIVIYRKSPASDRKSLQYLLIMALVPLVLFILISIVQKAFVYRYMAHVAIFIYLLAGVLMALSVQYWRPLKSAVFAILILGVLGFGIVTLSHTGNLVFERLQTPKTQQLRAAIDCQDAVVIADDAYTYIDSTFYFQDCDQRFFSRDEIAKKGGYAMLAGSQQRLSDPEQLTAPTVYHLRWAGSEPSFEPSSRYTLESSQQFDRQVVDTYVLSEE